MVILAAIVGTPSAAAAPAPPDVTVTINRAGPGPAVPAGFVGLSLEYPTVPAYAGRDPSAINPVLVQLIRNLVPRKPILRIGGQSTDWSWWPVPGLRRPRTVFYDLSTRWVATMRALALATGAQLILGINLKTNSQVIARTEATELLKRIGRPLLQGFEIGNEPDLYPSRGRPREYDFQSFASEFGRIARVLPRRVPLVGPATGSGAWLARVPELLATEPRLKEVTFHRYPLNACFRDPASPPYPTLRHLLAPFATRWPPPRVRSAIATAHSHGASFRVDELNSVSCGGRAGVSDTFAAALWMLDGLFRIARAGVEGVNIHVRPGAQPNELWAFRRVHGRWLGSVHPLYYGVLMFARATPSGSRFVQVTTTGVRPVHVWATIDPAGAMHVTLINDSMTSDYVVLVRLRPRAGHLTLERLSAPNASATSGVTIAGQSFGAETATGALTGSLRTAAPRPSARGCRVTLPSASAAVLTVAPPGSG